MVFVTPWRPSLVDRAFSACDGSGEGVVCVCGLWLVCGLVGVLWVFLVREGVRVFVCVLVCVCFFWLCVFLFALFAACVVSSF